MANIFRSKDIYKRAPKIPSSEDPMRVVKGVYVVGDYKPPYYMNSGLQITNINTNKATVVDYTEDTQSVTDHVVNLLDINASTDQIDITCYTQDSQNLQSDHVVNIIDINASLDQVDILAYSKITQNLQSDHVVNLIGIDASVDQVDIVYYTTKKYPSNPEPMLRIKSIITNKATIVDA